MTITALTRSTGLRIFSILTGLIHAPRIFLPMSGLFTLTRLDQIQGRSLRPHRYRIKISQIVDITDVHDLYDSVK
jgi:hypothetical protein